jgi:2-C-methyl-D-erythritol 4-phosphate cytidylyltransferase
LQQFVIIVAGGIGTRMKSDRPKQFIELLGVPVIIRTLHCFIDYDPAMQVIICVHRNYRSHLEVLIEKYNLKNYAIRITFGGETRFESVRNGLKLIENDMAIVGIHDSARPFVSAETIKNCYETALVKGNAVPCQPVTDSLRKISNNINHSVNRNEYKIVQTPQCFRAGLIRQAFEQVNGTAFTDDASVLEASGESINLVEGNEENFKITSPHDLLIARAILQK